MREEKKKRKKHSFVYAPTPTLASGTRPERTYLVCPACTTASVHSALLHRRGECPSVSVPLVLVVAVIVVAVPVGEMATVRRDARANDDCRRRQRLHAAVLAERCCGGDGGGAARHRVCIDAALAIVKVAPADV